MCTLLVASGGGHLKQLHRLLPRLGVGSRRRWLTFDTPLARSLLEDEDVDFAPLASPHDLLGTIRDTRAAARTLRRHQVTDVISTGANLAVATMPLARAMGIRCTYIESATRADGPSLTGRILAKVPGVDLWTQHPHLARGRWRYGGSVFDGFRVERAPAPRPVRTIVVTTGVNERYPFTRLVDRLRTIIPARIDVHWQTGTTPAEGALPGVEMQELLRHADLVIAHAGTGSAISALESGHRPVLVPRRRAWGEHVDDHQLATATHLRQLGLATVVDVDDVTWDQITLAAGWNVTAVAAAPWSLVG